jgi:hypothetical protein
MRPGIQDTKFGSIKIDGAVYEHDVVIRLSGEVKKRKKKLSKAKYGTSHTVSLDEAKHIYDEGAKRLIIGTGQHGMLGLSDEAVEYFKGKGCAIDPIPTPEAAELWNRAKGQTIGVFHVTC